MPAGLAGHSHESAAIPRRLAFDGVATVSRIIFGLGVVLATSLGVLASNAAAVTSEQAVAFLNQQRAANGIPGDLVNRSDWADGCAKHNLYSQMTGDWGHSENRPAPITRPRGPKPPVRRSSQRGTATCLLGKTHGSGHPSIFTSCSSPN